MTKQKVSSLSLQPSAFLPELKKLVTGLSEDLLARSTATAEVDAGLREAYKQIEKGGRTADAFEVWREDYLDQVAVAWVLGCVFVRFMEDNHLIDECWLSGDGDRRKLAEDNHELYFRAHPHESDREYFEHVFHEVGKIPACRELFAEGKTPLWAVGPSGDMAMRLLAFWREVVPETGQLRRSFAAAKDEGGSSSFLLQPSEPTRFLGDLYQDLSERARKKYALLQTPVFVEEFILDRTLNPAIDEFGLDKVRMIDPTCGSGHFLLGGFTRLFDMWIKREDNEVVAAQKALDGVWGCDINPFAVAIARFRLIVAALRACGIERIKDAPGWNIHVATGDSLLFGSRWNRDGRKRAEVQYLDESWAPAIYACEDQEAISEVLGQQYHAVVGNPPYITVKDKSLNAAYRDRYSTCHRQYSLAVPFTERFFDLAKRPEPRPLGSGASRSGPNIPLPDGPLFNIPLPDGRGSDVMRESGYVGMITANSFMKREFGKKLIEEFFPKTDLTHVLDTSGAYIPGHGTPTVILVGRAQRPERDTVRAVLGIKGEPSTPDDPSQGLVWQSIVQQIDRADSQDDFTSTADVPRATFNRHPWSMSGGGASELKEQIESAVSESLSEVVSSIGFYQDTHADEIFVQPADFVNRHNLNEAFRPQIRGDEIRDWTATSAERILFPYDDNLVQWPEFPSSPKWAWIYRERTVLWNRSTFGGGTYRSSGRTWYDYHQFPIERARTPLSISFAFVATHNHFVLDRGGKVFNRSAPIIKLSLHRAEPRPSGSGQEEREGPLPDGRGSVADGATEDDHLALLGLLNSSTGCFWAKQTLHDKGGGGIGGGLATEFWEHFFEFTGTGLQRFPLPESQPLTLARKLDDLGNQFADHLPESVVQAAIPTAAGMSEARSEAASIRGRMIALQEELDWECYRLYGLIDEDLRFLTGAAPDPSTPSRDRKEADGRADKAPGPVLTDDNWRAACRTIAKAETDPRTYFITFTCYGTWLHGDRRGSVDRDHNQPGTPSLEPDEERERREFALLRHAPVKLGPRQRAIVHQTIEEVCQHRGWRLHALNVRTNHVHVVVTANRKGKRVYNDFKSYATRRMNEADALPESCRQAPVSSRARKEAENWKEAEEENRFLMGAAREARGGKPDTQSVDSRGKRASH